MRMTGVMVVVELALRGKSAWVKGGTRAGFDCTPPPSLVCCGQRCER